MSSLEQQDPIASLSDRIDETMAKLAAIEGVLIEVIAPIIGAMPTADILSLTRDMRTQLHVMLDPAHQHLKLVVVEQIGRLADRIEQKVSANRATPGDRSTIN